MGVSRKVRGATRAELVAIGKEGSALGLTALTLAGRLDDPGTPGTAMAAMAKELRTVMAQLTSNTAQVGDPVDELQRRREARRRGA